MKDVNPIVPLFAVSFLIALPIGIGLAFNDVFGSLALGWLVGGLVASVMAVFIVAIWRTSRRWIVIGIGDPVCRRCKQVYHQHTERTFTTKCPER